MKKNFFQFLKISHIQNLNHEERFVEHKKNLQNKKMLKNCYTEFYIKILKLEKNLKKKKGKTRIELGSGVGFIKDFDQKIITSDVVKNKFSDKIIDANKLPYGNNKIDSIFGIFCFHHFKNPYNFLRDIEKKLKVGGICILVEPYYGPFASLIYKKIHNSEYFDKNEKIGFKVRNKTAMEKANQALSYIYFIKNKDIFKKKFPKLKITHNFVFNNYLRFLISGGLNFKNLLPDCFDILIKFIELLLTPFKKIFGIHYLIAIKKIN